MDSLFYNFRGEKNLISRPDLEELEQRLGLQVIKKKTNKPQIYQIQKGKSKMWKCSLIWHLDTLLNFCDNNETDFLGCLKVSAVL